MTLHLLHKLLGSNYPLPSRGGLPLNKQAREVIDRKSELSQHITQDLS